MAVNSNSFIGHLLNTIITTIGVLGVAYLTGAFDQQTAQISAHPDEMRVLFDRIKSLESTVRLLQDELLAVKAENTLQKIQLQKEWGSSPRATLWSYMEALDTPAWCKEFKEPDFLMAYINHAYESFYGVTKERYIGQTDFNVHPPKITQAWREHDMVAFQRKGFVRFTENVPLKNGEIVKFNFWKFYLRMPDQSEFLCGIQVDPE